MSEKKEKDVISHIDFRFLNCYLNEHQNIVVIKHIPHCSIDVPEGFVDSLDMDRSLFNFYNLRMSDISVDKLFADIPGIELKAKYSRLFCDVERFKDPNLEPMEKLGQGYKYKRFYDGHPLSFKNDLEEKRWDKVRDEYYDEWHSKLNETVEEQLRNGKDVLILDLHSFSNVLANSLGKERPYPDICIGFNDDFFSNEILDELIKEIRARGHKYRFNYPYSGSMVPNNIMQGKVKGNIYSFMLEVNKRIYL